MKLKKGSLKLKLKQVSKKEIKENTRLQLKLIFFYF